MFNGVGGSLQTEDGHMNKYADQEGSQLLFEDQIFSKTFQKDKLNGHVSSLTARAQVKNLVSFLYTVRRWTITQKGFLPN